MYRNNSVRCRTWCHHHISTTGFERSDTPCIHRIPMCMHRPTNHSAAPRRRRTPVPVRARICIRCLASVCRSPSQGRIRHSDWRRRIARRPEGIRRNRHRTRPPRHTPRQVRTALRCPPAPNTRCRRSTRDTGNRACRNEFLPGIASGWDTRSPRRPRRAVRRRHAVRHHAVRRHAVRRHAVRRHRLNRYP